MKAIVLSAIILISTSAFAGGLAQQIHESSSGKLIQISQSGSLVGVTSALGEYSLLKDSSSVVQVANVLCDLKKSWNATNDGIFCIAK
ncbi:MAG: hypothetical protein EOP06_29405 [Proteobacteria bacterium]|nr:MAG: hypothetical protein EOP06_29405 [Pseudomonadota bacterium]